MTGVHAAIYLRVSLDSTGEGLAVARQREDCVKLAVARGWKVVGEYTDNSISASDAGKVRPDYDRLVADYAAGKFEAVVVWDLDRLTRQPRQLEDWIDAAEQRGLKLVTANGEADLATDGGRMYARIKAAVARAEVERKGARQSRAQRQRAEMGRPPAGIRPLGYTRHGELIPAEADIVRRIFDRFGAGDSLVGIARDLEADGIPTRRGGRWTPSTVSTVLRNARYAGRSVLKGEVVGAADWKPIVSEAQFDAVAARLSDPRRVTNRVGTARRHIGSGIYRCECGLAVRSTSGLRSSGHRYACREGHFYRAGEPVDALVLAVLRERLGMPDLAEILATEADAGTLAELASHRKDLQHRLAVIESDYDSGLIDGRRYASAAERVQAEISAVQRQQIALVSAAGPSSILGAPDPVAAFETAPLDIRRHVIDALMTVTLHPAPRGSRTFRPDSVTITWR